MGRREVGKGVIFFSPRLRTRTVQCTSLPPHNLLYKIYSDCSYARADTSHLCVVCIERSNESWLFLLLCTETISTVLLCLSLESHMRVCALLCADQHSGVNNLRQAPSRARTHIVVDTHDFRLTKSVTGCVEVAWAVVRTVERGMATPSRFDEL